jgi:hypothetical protein
MVSWWHRDVIAAGKLPLMLCFLAFVITFVTTRTITRMIRDGRGPFRNQVTASGTHIHHSVPGIILLIIGAFSPFGVKDVDDIELSLRLTATGVLIADGVLAFICVLKGKYRTALFGLFLPPVGVIGALRLARPRSIWARDRYRGRQLERATRRAADFDKRWAPLQTDWEDFIGGRPSQPNPPASDNVGS